MRRLVSPKRGEYGPWERKIRSVIPVQVQIQAIPAVLPGFFLSYSSMYAVVLIVYFSPITSKLVLVTQEHLIENMV
jgi:hypothetical protein